MKRFLTLMMITIILLGLTLLTQPLSEHTRAESDENLRQLVKEAMGDYVGNFLDWPETDYVNIEYIYIEHWITRYNVPRKGIIDMGDMYVFTPLEDFLKELANKSDIHAFLQQLKQNLENPQQYPNATFIGGDSVDYVDVSLSSRQGVMYEYSPGANTKFSFATSVGLVGGDEAQYTIIELRVIKSGVVDHRIWERVLHFEQSNGVPGNALSLFGIGEKFQIMVTNDDPYSQTYRIYRSYQEIP